MKIGGKLDQACPNVKEHGDIFHQLDYETFMENIKDVLCNKLSFVEEMNVHGSRGALFKIKLPTSGYTVAAKGTGTECVEDLMHESAIYQCLHPIQGRHIPVHLGDMPVDGPIYYAGAVLIVHMMFLSFVGYPLQSPIPLSTADEAVRGLRAIHELGVLQKDPAPRNILVHPDRPGEVSWIDFERAEYYSPRPVLGSLSANRKRKKYSQSQKSQKTTDVSAREISEAEAQLANLVGL